MATHLSNSAVCFGNYLCYQDMYTKDYGHTYLANGQGLPTTGGGRTGLATHGQTSLTTYFNKYDYTVFDASLVHKVTKNPSDSWRLVLQICYNVDVATGQHIYNPNYTKFRDVVREMSTSGELDSVPGYSSLTDTQKARLGRRM